MMSEKGRSWSFLLLASFLLLTLLVEPNRKPAAKEDMYL